MGWLAVCALTVLVLGGCYLMTREWRRYRADRSPAPPPPPEEAALDGWNAGMVMLVAGISIVGAFLAFWAANDFSNASSSSQQALQEATQYQTVKSEQDGFLNFGAELSQALEEHTVDESGLFNKAASAWSAGDAQLAGELEAQARVQGAAERALAPGFTCYWPSAGLEGTLDYNLAGLRASEIESPCVLPDQDSTSLRTLNPAHQAALVNAATNDRSKAEAIVLSGAFLILAVFFLTISYLGSRHRRLYFLTPGVASVAVALGLSAALGLA